MSLDYSPETVTIGIGAGQWGSLWPHQVKALTETRRAFTRGAKAVCVVMSTGAGKTRLGGAFASHHLEKKTDGSVLWVAHREELVGQAYDDLTSWGLCAGVIQSNPTRPVNPHRPVQVASIHTLLARGMVPNASLLVLDEFHHYASDKWEPFAADYRKRGVPLVGLTATPIRGDGRGFEGLMDQLVCPITMRELIEQGFLVPYTLHDPGRTLGADEIAKSPVWAYQRHAAGRKALVFAGNLKAAEQFTAEFNAAGIRCEMIWGAMDPLSRRNTLAKYKAGEIRVLCNMGVLTEGFDDRETSCVILARSIGTLSLYLQMCGRALRCCPEKGKTDAVIIDLHGTCRKSDFGEPDEDRDWTLEGRGVRTKNLEQPTERFCFVCKVLLEPGAGNVCDLCGIARPEAIPPEVLNVELVKYAAKLREPETVRRAYFTKLQRIAADRGWSPWQPHQKYKAIYGEPPPRQWY